MGIPSDYVSYNRVLYPLIRARPGVDHIDDQREPPSSVDFQF